MTIISVRYIPNMITFIRIPLTFLLAYFLLSDVYPGAILVFAVICLSDLADGAAARALEVCTRFGANLDIAADVLYVMVSLVLLNIRGLASVWFTAVVALEFMQFTGTSLILNKIGGNDNDWVFDGPGRCFAVLAFLSPGVFCLCVLFPELSEYISYCLYILSCVFAITSTAIRAARCIHYIKSERIASILKNRHIT